MSLPRTYWCHAATADPAPGAAPRGTATPLPGQAIAWLREAARDLAFRLDHAAFAVVWAWLGDHPGVGVAVRELRCGRAYAFSFGDAERQWALVAHPVLALPLARSCLVLPTPSKPTPTS